MGFWDKVKSVGNMITGGAAAVFVETEETAVGGTLRVLVKANAKSDLKINGVYVKVRGKETVVIPNVTVPQDVDFDGDFEFVGRDIQRVEISTELESSIAGPEELKEGEEYTWEGEIQIPSNALPTYRGLNAAHEWEIFAGLDAFGNDPDSNWQDFTVNPA